MFFRIILLIFLCSCGLKMNEDAPRAVPLVIPGASLGCSVNIFEKNDSYFQGNATEAEIVEFWKCTDSALTLFMDNTRGAEKGKYLSSELKNFLETYFFDNRTIPTSLFNEAMNLRVGIMGGVRDEVSREDIELLIQFTHLIRDEMLRAKKYMPFSMSTISELEEQKFESLISDLRISIKNTGDFFLRFSGSYKISYLDLLMGGLKDYLSDSKNEATIAESLLALVDSYQKYQPVLKLAKRTVSPQSDPDVFFPKDFDDSFQKAYLGVDFFLRFKYWQNKYNLDFEDKGLDALEKTLKSFSKLAISVLTDSKDNTLSFELIDEWVDLIDQNKWTPLDLEKQSLKNILRPLIQKVLAGQDDSLTGRRANGLTLTAFKRTIVQIHEWVLGQKYLRTLFSAKKVLPRAELLASLRAIKDTFYKGNNESGAPFILNDINWVIQSQRPLFYGSEPYLSYPHGHMSSHHNLSLTFLSQMHWMRTLGRLAISGYTSNLEKKSAAEISRMGLSMNEFQTLYRDLTEVGIQLKFIFKGNTEEDYKNNTDSGSKRFREANLFVSRSDGGQFAHMDEAVEYFSFLFSTKSLSETYYKEFSEACGTFQSEDVFGFKAPFIGADCFRSELYKRIENPDDKVSLNFLKPMPRLVKYYQSLSIEDKELYQSKLEKASRIHLKSSDAFQRADLESYLMVLQYVETAFLKYDLDSNEVLNEEELDVAYSVFYVALKEIIDQKMPGLLSQVESYSGGFLTEDMVMHLIYTYLLYYGKPPSFDIVSGSAELMAWWRKRYLPVWPVKAPKLEATRMTFLNVMAALGEATVSTAEQK